MKNAVVWSEIAGIRLKRATAFYEKLLDGKLKPESFGPYELRASSLHAADGIAAAFMKGEGYEPSGKGTVTISRRARHRRALKRATGRGAKFVDGEDGAAGNQGFIAHVSDCEGNAFGLHRD